MGPFLLRTIQGHSDAIVQQLNPAAAHTPFLHDALRDTLDIAHYAESWNLWSILGVQTPGLVPGGLTKRRGAVRFSQVLSTDGIVPDKFRRHGIDCQIVLDTAQMLKDGIKVFLSDAGSILVYDTVGVKYIKRITMLASPRITVYRRPTQQDLEAKATGVVWCRGCAKKQRLGIWSCVYCWSLITYTAIADTQSFLSEPSEKVRELKERYNLDAKELHALVSVAGSSINGIARKHFVRNADVPRPKYNDAGAGTTRFARASSAAPAVSTGQSTRSRSPTQVGTAAPASSTDRTQVRREPAERRRNEGPVQPS